MRAKLLTLALASLLALPTAAQEAPPAQQEAPPATGDAGPPMDAADPAEPAGSPEPDGPTDAEEGGDPVEAVRRESGASPASTLPLDEISRFVLVFNAVRAGHVEVVAARAGGRLRVEVSDDGSEATAPFAYVPDAVDGHPTAAGFLLVSIALAEPAGFDPDEGSFLPLSRSGSSPAEKPKGTSAMASTVLIVGAGPGGLAAAMQLAYAGAGVTLLERRDVVGGVRAGADLPRAVGRRDQR